MTQEEKELLIKDLCGRLPYGVVYHRNDGANIKLNAIDVKRGLLNYTDDIDERECKPYLRSLSSMTEEEIEELKKEHLKDEKLFIDCIEKSKRGDDSMRGKVITHFASDWCDKNMFDYRGLIPMGLALEATKDMYQQLKTK